MLDILNSLFGYLLHFEVHLDYLITNYQLVAYAILFLIIFAETGLIIFPFLPGDSLLFAVGAICARGSLHFFTITFLMFFAAVIGDSLNYWIGKSVGPKIFDQESGRFFNKNHLERSRSFYQKYGAKTIILGRFIPIVRTFAPFVAGIGNMTYKNFMSFNVLGAGLWVYSFCGLGYFVGNQEQVKKNFKMVIVGIIIISILPAIFEFINERRNASR